MGRVRTKTVKKSAKVIIERYYPKLSLDFETNKRICDEVGYIQWMRMWAWNANVLIRSLSLPRSVSGTRLPDTPPICTFDPAAKNGGEGVAAMRAMDSYGRASNGV